MKWAIDKLFERGLINGWVSANDGNKDKKYRINIKTPEKTLYSASINNFRPDVKAVGLQGKFMNMPVFTGFVV